MGRKRKSHLKELDLPFVDEIYFSFLMVIMLITLPCWLPIALFSLVLKLFRGFTKS